MNWVRVTDLGWWPLFRHVMLVMTVPAAVSILGLVVTLASGAGWMLFLGLLIVILFGIVGSYLVHEVSHLIFMRKLAPTALVRWEMTWGRVSLMSKAPLVLHRSALVASAGPIVTALIGVAGFAVSKCIAAVYMELAMLTGVLQAISFCYCVHLAFLLPAFSDGRIVALFLSRCLAKRT